MKTRIIITAILILSALGAFGVTPQSKHVVLVVEENHSFDAVLFALKPSSSGVQQGCHSIDNWSQFCPHLSGI